MLLNYFCHKYTKPYNQFVVPLQAAIKTCNMIIKRFKTRPDAWIAFGLILYKSGKFDDARNILDRCVHQLEKKDRKFRLLVHSIHVYIYMCVISS